MTALVDRRTPPLVAHWPADWTPSVRDRAASTAFVLLLSTRQWVHRRVEHVRFVDENSIRRHVSVDFTVPALHSALLAAETVGGLAVAYVPLTLLRKRSLMSFDLRDEDGRALPFLSRRQNNQVASRMLVMLAEAILDSEPLADSVREDLQQVACQPQEQATLAMQRLLAPADSDPSGLQRRRLMAEPRLMTLAEELTNNYLLLAPVDAVAGSRRVLKFSYEERPGAPVATSRWQRLCEHMSFRPVPLLLPAAALGDAASAHIEIELPEDLEVETLRAIDARTGQDLATEQVQINAQDHQGLQRVHLHYSGLDRSTWGLVELGLAIRRSGLLVASLACAIITAAIITAGLTQLDGLVKNTDAGSAMLIAVPGLFASYLLRPGEHRLVSRLFGGLRAMVFISALCALGAAGSVILGFSHAHLELIWAVMASGAWFSAVMITGAAIFPLDRFRQRHAHLAKALEITGRVAWRVLRVGRTVRRRVRGVALPPMNVRQAVTSLGLELHGTPVESAEGWRAGPGGDSGKHLDGTLTLAARMVDAADLRH